MNTVTRRTALAVSVASLATLAACESSSDEQADGSPASDGGGADAGSSGSWPRTVGIDGQDLELEAPPERIVAVSTETGDLALELVGPERLIAVAPGSREEDSGNQVELADQVEETVAGAPSPDPEQVLALEPDLVLLTSRHDDEQNLAESLATTGVPAAAFASADFQAPESVIEVLTTLGEVLGAEDRAQEIADGIADQVDAVTATVAGADGQPRTLGLFARGGRSMVMAAESATSSLIELAGGTSISREEGWHSSPPADPEALIAAAPDVILVQDFHGAGLDPFADLLESDALADVPAVRDDQVHLVDAVTTSGTAGSSIGDGLEQIAQILHPELF